MPEQDYEELNIDPAIKVAMAEYLYNEISKAKRDRQKAVDTWNKIQELYEQLNIPGKKDIPWQGAADLMVPIIATYVEQLHARLMDTVYAPEEPYSCIPTREDLYKYSKSIKKWCSWASGNEWNEEETDASAFMELLKLGTMVKKVVYERYDEKLFVWNKTLKRFEAKIERQKDNVEELHIPITKFLWQMHARNIDESEWKAHEFPLSWNEIKLRVKDRRFMREAAEEVRTYLVTHETDETRQTVQTEIGIEPAPTSEYSFHEVWFRYPIKIDPSQAPIDADTDTFTPVAAIPVKLKGVFHWESKTFMSLQYNTFPLGLDPFELCPFVKREQQVIGIGVGHMALPFQIEIATMHCQRLDNATVVNAAAFKYKADSAAPEQIGIRPGGGIPVDEMDDLEAFELGHKYDSTIPAEQHTLQLLEQRLGVREVAMDDMSMAKAPATTTLALLQEKGRRLDNVIRNIRRFKKRLVLKKILLTQQYYPKEKFLDLFGPEDGARIIELLETLSPQQIWDGLGVELAATTTATSKELERQSKMALFNVLLGYYDKYIQYVAGAAKAPPPLQQILVKMGEGLTTFVGEILESFSSNNKRDYLINLQEIFAQAQQAQASAPANGATAPAAPGAVPQPGVETAPAAGPAAAAA